MKRIVVSASVDVVSFTTVARWLAKGGQNTYGRPSTVIGLALTNLASLLVANNLEEALSEEKAITAFIAMGFPPRQLQEPGKEQGRGGKLAMSEAFIAALKASGPMESSLTQLNPEEQRKVEEIAAAISAELEKLQG